MTDIVERLRKDGSSWAQSLFNEAADEIERMRAALEPFAEVARRLGWDKLDDNSREWNEHVLEAPADDIAPGAFYVLHVSDFAQIALGTDGDNAVK